MNQNTIKPTRLLQDALYLAAIRFPTKVAIVTETARMTYFDLWQQSLRFSQALRAKGIPRGARVVIFMDNDWQCAVALYGSLYADCVFTVVNPLSKSEKLTYMINDCQASVLVTSHALEHTTRLAITATPHLQYVLVTDLPPEKNPDTRLHNFQNTLTAVDQPVENGPPPRNISRDLSALIYTSGSTGTPKGVMQTHQSMLFALESLCELLKITHSDRIICVLPLAFNYGLYQLLMTIHSGATLILERSFAYPSQTFKIMAAEGVTVFPGVPTIFKMLITAHERQPLCFMDMRCVTNTAATLPPDYNGPLRAIFPQASIYRMYGLTECKRVSYLPPEDFDRKPASVGIAIPGTEVMVLNSIGEPVPPGVTGVLHVRGAHVMAGYWNQPENTAHMLKPGPTPGEMMLCTHDLFTIDTDGYLYYIGRSDDIIKSRGEKVSPTEVEAALLKVNGIYEAAVVGTPDPLLGHAVCAFVSLSPDHNLTETLIRKFCAQHLESYMVPSRVMILPDLPKTGHGKIDKKTLMTFL